MKMNPEVKVRWVEALRSGKYKQGRSELRTANDEFCCLGVLCDIAEQEGVISATREPWDDSDEEADEAHTWYYGMTSTVLPGVVREWAGLDDDNPMLVTDSAIQLNDEMACTFDEIANEIEEAL